MSNWRIIPGFSKYEASSDGFVRNAQTKHVLKSQNARGWLRLCIKSDAGRRTIQCWKYLISDCAASRCDALGRA